MSTHLPRFKIDLPQRSIFTLADAAGIVIECESGSVWVTLDNETRDIVLAPGERFVSDSHRRALVSALEPSGIALTMPRSALALAATEPASSRWRLWPSGLVPA